MSSIPRGHRRTGLCPTFARPSAQRDGLLLRVPLVGGSLDQAQVACLADVAGRLGSGTLELTNRANVQVRGLSDDTVGEAQRLCQAVGLGDRGASLVSISAFADPTERRVRAQVLEALLDVAGLSPRFVVHVGDHAPLSADAVLTCTGAQVALAIAGLGVQRVDADGAVRQVRELALACAALGTHARAPDIYPYPGQPVSARAEHGWPVGSQAVGAAVVALAAARFGRLSAAQFGTLAGLLRSFGLARLHVTPWRSCAFVCRDTLEAERVLVAAAVIGLLTDPRDPAVRAIACIGRAGCWQTELDTLGEAERLVAHWPSDLADGALVHISGCDKLCATRAPVALTLLGRSDSSGFERR